MTKKKDDSLEQNSKIEELENDVQDEVNGNNELEKCEEKAQNLENQVKRALADYQNLQKRVQEERISWIKTANKDLIARFLPILDTLMLAQKHVKDQGIELSIKQFLQALQDEVVEKIQTEGKQFDPHTMECVQLEEGEDGKVLEEIRAGYTIEDRAIRPAQVKVGQKS